MKLTFVHKQPDTAYVADRLWLPKAKIRVDPVKKALEFQVTTQTGMETITMWSETKSHIICPREFIPASEYKSYDFKFVDLAPKFQKVEFKDFVIPRNKEQEMAWESLKANDNGILNLACGKGKTKLALKKIAQKGVPTLVIVPDGGIFSQWEESILGNKEKGISPSLSFDGELGVIRGPVFNWNCPITIALVTTLWMRIEKGLIPQEFYSHHGLLIYDEVHLIGAPKFNLTASPFYGDRIGLTATVQREDGLDPLYRYHIGDPFYTDLSQDLKPRIYFQMTPSVIPYEKAKNSEGVTNTSILRSILGRDSGANIYRYWAIKEALNSGRKILALSHSLDQLRLFNSMFPGSGLIIGDTPSEDRMSILRNSQICFAVAKLGSVGVDDDALDTLFWLTPFRSRVSLQQSMGRIQRKKEGKKTPVMIVFEDWMTPTLKKLCLSLKHSLKTWGQDYETCKPLKFPTTLPDDVLSSYLETYKGLKGGHIEED